MIDAVEVRMVCFFPSYWMNRPFPNCYRAKVTNCDVGWSWSWHADGGKCVDVCEMKDQLENGGKYFRGPFCTVVMKTKVSKADEKKRVG